MSFLIQDLDGSVPGVGLVLNAWAQPGSARLEQAPSPMNIGVDSILFVPNPLPSAYGFTAGALHVGEAVWPHVYWDVNSYGLNPEPLANGGFDFTVQVVGVLWGGLVFLDGPGFPFTPPNWFASPGYVPDKPEFRVVWNPGGGDIIDFVNPSGGQTGSASWDDATKTLTIVPQTYHPQTTFGAQALELVPAPQFVDPTPLVIPPEFGASKASPEPTALAESLVIPPVFGGLTVTPGSPDDLPPDVEPPPGGDPYGPPDGRPVVDSGGAVPGADVTGRSAAMRVSRVRVIGS